MSSPAYKQLIVPGHSRECHAGRRGPVIQACFGFSEIVSQVATG